MSKSVSIVLPVHNEVDVIEDVVKGFKAEVIDKLDDAELIVAEDGSSDGTKKVLKDLEAELGFRLETGNSRKGYLCAVKEALQLADKETIFFSDTDGTHNPEDFWRLYSKIDECDIVTGTRWDRDTDRYRKFFSYGYNTLVRFMYGVKVHDVNCGFNLMRREVIDTVVPEIKNLKYGFTTELIIRSYAEGYAVCEAPVEHKRRETGEADQFQPSNMPKVVREQFSGLLKLRKEV